MPRLFCPSGAARRLAAMAVAGGLILAAVPHSTDAAGGSKQLQRVRGTIGYQTADNGSDFKPVLAKFDLPDESAAVTRSQSAAVIAMPDSSLISLGENTTVKATAFDTTAAGPGSTITVNGGSLRFDIKRPVGGTANYHFVTTTSAVGVRGTVGLLSFVNGITTVGCVACAADSVTVTAGGQTVALATGQIITVSAAGVITTGALAAAVGAFTAAGVPITAQATAVAAGLPAAGGIAGVSAGTATAVGVGAAVAGTAIGIAASQPTAKPDNASTANPTSPPNGSGQPGNVNLNGTKRTPQVAATPEPPVARPMLPPGMGSPGGRPLR
jgi:hypothetical protein